MSSLAIIDYGGANLNSVVFAFERLGVTPVVTSDLPTIVAASHVVLPGVGAAGAGMKRLDRLRLPGLIRQLEQPVLGICLGMQLLFEHSEEGSTDCLGVIPGKVTKLPFEPGLTIPHMGWNENKLIGEHALLTGIPSGAYGYFVHSYAADLNSSTLGTSFHGKSFSSMVAHENYMGIQFHPERSGEFGAQLLRNFLNFATLLA